MALTPDARASRLGLHDPSMHHDACGLGFVARLDNRPSHEIVEQGLSVLCNLDHRGATGADAATGDGAGILVQIPDAFFRHARKTESIGTLPEAGWYGAGTCFFWGDEQDQRRAESLLEMIVVEEGQEVLGWRDVPVDLDQIGTSARRSAPRLRQVFIERHTDDRGAFERKLYLIRRRLHRTIERAFGLDCCYIVSLSSYTIVYKGLLQGSQVRRFFPDLDDPSFTSALALVHSRFSTNTAESWALAHPYRYIAHNGEINTVRGNLNWMRARQAQLESDLFGPDIPKLRPIIEPQVSDSAAFDNALEFLHLAGRSLPQAVMTMVPEAWENDHMMDADRRAFYHYSGALMQPWDGPAAIAFTNGRVIGAVLDRNGLRPARYSVTRDGLVVLASEDGVLPIDAADITERRRLGPGRMVVVDLERHRLLHDTSAKSEVVATHPYRQWVFDHAVGLSDTQVDGPPETATETTSLVERQRAFGYTYEELQLLLRPMAETGQEADGSMGTDTPLAVLSRHPRSLFDYFHQLFAQVTNPPIDPLRERTVMSLRVSLGRQHNLLVDGPHHARRIVLPSPVLADDELSHLKSLHDELLTSATISLLWDVNNTPDQSDSTSHQTGQTNEPDSATHQPDQTDQLDQLRHELDRICEEAEQAVRSGVTVLVLSDRGVDRTRTSIPTILATGAVRHHLIKRGLGGGAGLVLEAGDCREVHHFAALIAFGADAINPYLALETVGEMASRGDIAVSATKARRLYVKAVNKGLLKVISKMGISTLHSYCGSQLMEIVGIDRSVVDRCFIGATSRLGGLDLSGIGRERLEQHHAAFSGELLAFGQLDSGGEYKLRVGGPPHQWNERTIPALQRAVRTGDFETYEEFTRHADAESEQVGMLRSLFDFVGDDENPMSIDEVEPAAEIVKRFNTGAMSLGSISTETHESIAVAMNQIGGRSNSGEGGEDPERFAPDPDGTSRRSAIKQIASGRFGVTTHYIVNADMLQIKVAQGAKPGEGGQLPGHKVSADIARLRHSTPGVGLISPPPHHDIYSIEDLKQLIFDLKMANPYADVSVKLVAETGVGTIATGVAKARADHITIAGFEGGTGAAPASSIKHAGLPWEIGLAETQQTLVDNDLRGRVRLQVDGQLRTGRDVVIGALLGAEEFGFSTAPLVSMGCVMMRVCHLNTCPVGIATQDPELRAKFTGKPEHLVNYFFFVAEEVRKLMARLGFRRFDEMVGRSDMLLARVDLDHWKHASLDLSPILRSPATNGSVLRRSQPQEHNIDASFDKRIWAQVEPALNDRIPVDISASVDNTDLSIGARISGEIARLHGAEGLPDYAIKLRLRGTAGQSLGAWGSHGLSIELEGSANDYVGKGLSGARLVIRPPRDAAYRAESSMIAGNVALYGATSGFAHFGGIVGERFAVRNSGATAVAEGCGDHGCEYMTGGTVVILGTTGRNFAAGMSGGIAYVYEPERDLRTRCNLEMISFSALDEEDAELIHDLVSRHVELTGSARGTRIIRNWHRSVNDFVKVIPNELKRIIDLRATLEADNSASTSEPGGPSDTGTGTGESDGLDTGENDAVQEAV